MKKVLILWKIQATMKAFAPPFFNYFSLILKRKRNVVMKHLFAVNAFLEAVVQRYSLKKVTSKFRKFDRETRVY